MDIKVPSSSSNVLNKAEIDKQDGVIKIWIPTFFIYVCEYLILYVVGLFKKQLSLGL